MKGFFQNNQHGFEERKVPLIVIVGPTAVGKTFLAIQLAKRLNTEIISADSVQVYRYLDIGTAKPSLEEREGIPHHLIDIVDPDVNFTVYDYQRLARKCIHEVYSRGKIPILTGGTGLYIKAVLDEYVFSSVKVNMKIRKRLEEELKLKGKSFLYNFLKGVDPQAAARIHPNDARRIIRSLEFYYLTGEPISRQWELTQKRESPYRPLMFGLNMKRNLLYERIEKRIEQMIEKGLLDEVKDLLKRGYSSKLKSLQSLGYRHMIFYLEGKWNWEEAIHYFRKDTRNYAKRQLTWFRADNRIEWFELKPDTQFNLILDEICSKLEGN